MVVGNVGGGAVFAYGAANRGQFSLHIADRETHYYYRRGSSSNGRALA